MADLTITVPAPHGVSLTVGPAQVALRVPDPYRLTITAEGEAAPEPEPEPPADPWTPAELATAPTVWLDAADTESLTFSGAAVTIWGNRGSAVVTFSALVGTATPPAYSAVGLNGRPTIEFDGLFDKFFSSSASVTTLLGASDFAVFLVGRADSAGFNNANSWLNSGFWGDRGGWVGLPVRSVGTVAAYAYDAVGDNNPQVPYTIGANALFHSEISGGRNRMRLNAGDEASIASGGISGGFGEQIIIGRVGSFDEHSLDGAISEFLIVKPAPDAETRQRIEGYLAHKWGLAGSLPADHPYKATAPALA